MKTFFLFTLMVFFMCISACRHVVFVSGRTGNDQIFKMRANGASQSNISNNSFTDHWPDVSHDGKKIVFSSLRNGPGENIYTMNINGGNVQQLTTGSGQRTRPKWSGPPIDLIAFAYPSNQPNTQIWTIRTDGTGIRQVTNPGANESDDGGHDFYWGGKKIVFSRYNTGTKDRDLYSVYFDGTQDFKRITNTPDVSETLPAVSRNGRMLAYRATNNNDGSRDIIRIVTINTWSLVREITMLPPASINICGIDFSTDDSRLFVGIQSSDVPGNLTNIKSEIFSIDIYGQNQIRLTNNKSSDCSPVSVPK